MRKIFFLFAIICWTISLYVHLAALIFDYTVSTEFPLIWLLHLGIFVVWIPTVYFLRNNTDIIELRKIRSLSITKHIDFFRRINKKRPKELIVLAIFNAIYSFFNFLVFFLQYQGTAKIKDGQFILEEHGHFIKSITETEYNHYLANDIRAFSGHWMVFYIIAATFLFQYRKNKKSSEVLK